MGKQFNNLNNSLKKNNKYIFPKDGNSEDSNISEQIAVSVNKKLTWLLHWSICRIPNKSQASAKHFL